MRNKNMSVLVVDDYHLESDDLQLLVDSYREVVKRITQLKDSERGIIRFVMTNKKDNSPAKIDVISLHKGTNVHLSLSDDGSGNLQPLIAQLDSLTF